MRHSCRYSEALKREAVRLHRSSGKGYRLSAEERGVSACFLRRRVDRYSDNEEATLSEREELPKLHGDSRILREER